MKIAVIAAAVATLLFEYKGLKKKFILSWVTLIFFVFKFISVVIFDNKWVMIHAWVLSNATLAFIAWFSILIKCPFTLQYAKELVSSDKWNHPFFIRINYILTIAWGIIFLISALVNILRLYNPDISLWIYELLTDGAVIFGIWFNIWFPKWYQIKKSINYANE